jgi:hypothetical protein
MGYWDLNSLSVIAWQPEAPGSHTIVKKALGDSSFLAANKFT